MFNEPRASRFIIYPLTIWNSLVDFITNLSFALQNMISLQKVIFTAYHYTPLNRINLLISYFAKRNANFFRYCRKKAKRSKCLFSALYQRSIDVISSIHQGKLKLHAMTYANVKIYNFAKSVAREFARWVSLKRVILILQNATHIYAARKHNITKKEDFSRVKNKSKMLNKIFSYQASFSRDLILKFEQLIIYLCSLKLKDDDLILYYQMYLNDGDILKYVLEYATFTLLRDFVYI